MAYIPAWRQNARLSAMPLLFLHAKVHLLCRNSNFCGKVFHHATPKRITRGLLMRIRKPSGHAAASVKPCRRHNARPACNVLHTLHAHTAHAAHAYTIRHTHTAAMRNNVQEALRNGAARLFSLALTLSCYGRFQWFCYILRFNITAKTTGAPITGVMKFMGKQPPSGGR